MAIRLTLVLVALFQTTVASGVTPGLQDSRVVAGAESVQFVTTTVAERAATEVQIRRIKNLLVTSSLEDADAAFEKLEKLQHDLRGQR